MYVSLCIETYTYIHTYTYEASLVEYFCALNNCQHRKSESLQCIQIRALSYINTYIHTCTYRGSLVEYFCALDDCEHRKSKCS